MNSNTTALSVRYSVHLTTATGVIIRLPFWNWIRIWDKISWDLIPIPGEGRNRLSKKLLIIFSDSQIIIIIIFLSIGSLLFTYYFRIIFILFLKDICEQRSFGFLEWVQFFHFDCRRWLSELVGAQNMRKIVSQIFFVAWIIWLQT